MEVRADSAPMRVPAEPSSVAPRLLAAYAIGAALWSPMLVLVAGQFENLLARVVPGFLVASTMQMVVAMWVLRFALYIIGAHRRWDYGYGINGVIVNPRLTLAEKAQRIARDWFGAMLIVVWGGFMLASFVAMIATR